MRLTKIIVFRVIRQKKTTTYEGWEKFLIDQEEETQMDSGLTRKLFRIIMNHSNAKVHQHERILTTSHGQSILKPLPSNW